LQTHSLQRSLQQERAPMSKNPKTGSTQRDLSPRSTGGGGSSGVVPHPHIVDGHWNPGVPTTPALSATNKNEFFGPGEMIPRLRLRH
jgi:hypothetical protein